MITKIKNKYHQGFTLIELLVVIAILGVLASIVITSVSSSRTKALKAKAQAELDGIRATMEVMASDTDEWPGHQLPNKVNETSIPPNEIEDITVESAGLAATDGSYDNWNGPYVNPGMLDPWGNPYFFDTDYDLNGGVGPVNYGVAIGSYGPNGVGPNIYDSDDIIRILVRK